ncbi:hydroxyacid dehydrogenase [Bacillus sp. SG-1]|uniref:hydroxyacid dehydrogenase n=1 Tax=Bacillus sp. SG-1 TaxID=161544 RepID=UPI000154393D|nr:hydroxyacid dehydrogenase [Bacillus sp. SG-1]EDL65577.1 hypothetical protein BSG1_00725 [Bacillus sp. SG-1]
MNFKVLIPQPIAKEGIDLLEKEGAEVIIPPDYNEETLISHVSDVDAILIRTAKLSRVVIEKASKLKVIARHGIGVDNIDLEAASDRGILVTNAPFANVNAVAEHVLTLILSGSRQLIQVDSALRNGDFEVRNRKFGIELKGKTLGVVGFGNIGQLVAEKCHYGLGMDVLVYDPYVREENVSSYVQLNQSLSEVLASSDIVTIHVPYLPSTHHLINEEALQQMKKDAILVNAARGGIIDEIALEKALGSGEIRGACLDCFETEPPAVDHSLWNLENVIVTPHLAAHTEEAMIEMAVTPAKDIIAIMKGEKPLYPVNEKEIKVS